jgi:anti-sigma factor ChrR (cupin superfamily)
MSPQHRDRSEQVLRYVRHALPASEAAALEAHLAECAHCRQDVEAIRLAIATVGDQPADVLRPSASLWERLTRRVAAEAGQAPLSATGPDGGEPQWEDVGSGITVALLATDRETDRVSMLVRLAPGADYPPHRHAGVEEVYMLDGVLIVDDRKLYPGDYLRSEPDTEDHRVWSETGCTCVLITSARDQLR